MKIDEQEWKALKRLMAEASAEIFLLHGHIKGEAKMYSLLSLTRLESIIEMMIARADIIESTLL